MRRLPRCAVSRHSDHEQPTGEWHQQIGIPRNAREIEQSGSLYTIPGLCYRAPMTRSSAIARCLALIALIGLMLAPIARPALAMPVVVQGTMGQAMAGDPLDVAPGDMPCCPQKPSFPDCGKDCPFMALCAAAALIAAPQAALSVPITLAGIVFSSDQTDLASIARAPPQRPPKA